MGLGESNKVILLVEDEFVVAKMESYQLEQYGYTVIHATSGEQALEIFESTNPDLVLMDIDLGRGLNGPETANLILAIKDVPVVFLSSHTETEVVELTQRISAYGYVVKNSGITVLDASIKMAFKLFDANKKLELALENLRQHEIELKMQNDELQKSHEALRLSQSRYFDLYDLAPVGYITLNEIGFIHEANLTMANLLGVTRSALLNQPLSIYIHKDDQDIFYQFKKKLLGTKNPLSCELRLVKKDEKEVFVRLESSWDGGSQGGCFYKLVLSDVTTQKLTEETLRNTQRLESLGVLAGGIAHDFNNLLGGFYGYLALADLEQDKAEISKYLGKAKDSLSRTRSLTAQLMTFAKGSVRDLQVLSLDSFIPQTAQFTLSGSNCRLTLALPPDLWPVYVDKNQIGQVLENLILNAIQAMPAGGLIHIQGENVCLNLDNYLNLPQGNYVKISVQDKGVGIPKENFHRIFDPFFTTKENGHGLGLSSCYSIIKSHGGSLEVDSTLGMGSVFHFYLPASPGDGLCVDTSASGTHQGEGLILVMDDDENMRETLSKMLMAFGYTVVSKNNGSQGLEYVMQTLENHDPLKAVFLDLTVPGAMGGVALCKEIRKLHGTIPTFVLSGYSQDPVMIHPRDYGFTASLSKPFGMGELVSLLNIHIK